MVANSLKGRIIICFGSQADFAQAVGVNETFVSRVIHGRNRLSGEERKKWAEALKCKPTELFICLI